MLSMLAPPSAGEGGSGVVSGHMLGCWGGPALISLPRAYVGRVARRLRGRSAGLPGQRLNWPLYSDGALCTSMGHTCPSHRCVGQLLWERGRVILPKP